LNNTEVPGGIGAARDWLPVLARYRAPSQLRSLFEIAITAVPFVLLWILMWASLEWSYLLGLAVAVPAAGFLVRLFMIQHDCGHGSFFRRRWANNWTGRAIGVLTFTPYDHWRRSHAVHHASSGNLDRRGIDGSALVHGQHRPAPRPPPLQQDPILSPRPGSARSPRAAERRTHHAPRQPRLCAPGAVGRDARTDDLVSPAHCHAGRGRQPESRYPGAPSDIGTGYFADAKFRHDSECDARNPPL